MKKQRNRTVNLANTRTIGRKNQRHRNLSCRGADCPGAVMPRAVSQAAEVAIEVAIEPQQFRHVHHQQDKPTAMQIARPFPTARPPLLAHPFPNADIGSKRGLVGKGTPVNLRIHRWVRVVRELRQRYPTRCPAVLRIQMYVRRTIQIRSIRCHWRQSCLVLLFLRKSAVRSFPWGAVVSVRNAVLYMNYLATYQVDFVR